MSTGIIMNFRFMHNQGGRLYKHRVIGQVLWLLLCSPKGLMPSALRPNHMFLASSANSFPYFLSIFLHCDPSAGALNFPSFLRSSLCHRINLACSLFLNRHFNRGIIGAYIPHHVGRNPLPGALALNITMLIAADLIAQCTTYWSSVQILVLTAVEDAIIRACMYLVHLQS